MRSHCGTVGTGLRDQQHVARVGGSPVAPNIAGFADRSDDLRIPCLVERVRFTIS
jgi:hypothetical protein